MPKIINIPDFMEVEILDKNFNFLQTLLLFIKSRILILIFKYSNGILFCKLFNLFYKSHKLYDYSIFLKWRNISRLKTINYLFKNFNKVSIIAMFIKLLPQKAMLFLIKKFYEKELPTS